MDFLMEHLAIFYCLIAVSMLIASLISLLFIGFLEGAILFLGFILMRYLPTYLSKLLEIEEE